MKDKHTIYKALWTFVFLMWLFPPMPFLLEDAGIHSLRYWVIIPFVALLLWIGGGAVLFIISEIWGIDTLPPAGRQPNEKPNYPRPNIVKGGE